MKLTFFDDFRLGAVTDDGVIAIDTLVDGVDGFPPQLILSTVISQWSDCGPKFQSAIESGDPIALDSVRLRAPTPQPTSIVCMAGNYMEFGTLPEKPTQTAFFKSSYAVIGDSDTMQLPDVPASIFEGEAEMALVISKRASKVKPEDAMEYVFGYMNFVDGSARGLAAGMGLPYFMKCKDTFAPIGPYIVTADEIDDPHKLHIRQWNNGKVTHDYNTDDMAYTIAETVAFVTFNSTLDAGDVIAVGVNHGQLHPLQDGDVVEQEIDGLGRLTFKVEDELKRTWKRETRAERADAGEQGATPQLTGKYADG
ncbi:TPA: fumarylacetoacetate hydrolase [Candidatus Latescibacteria bacterium]|nr:fumarylacetoacetate hydrolase [Candidatus Latescibacterota bacterium]